MRPATATERDLHARADAAREHAHAPYSGFAVGAALVAASGAIVTAGNVENASYGLTICAERSAVVRALAEGATSFTAAAVAAEGTTVSPCGACRQVLCEFAAPGMTVTFPHEGQLVTFTLDELLPRRFVR
jgi:cytidine deaminase